MSKTYILLKDLPDSKAGDKYVWMDSQEAYYKDGDLCESYWQKENVEGNDEWFRLIITGLIGVNIKGNVITDYVNTASISIDGNGKVSAIGIDGKVFIPDTNQYTEEDMRKCFAESRLTHGMIGFKHPTFSDYLKTINK